MSVATDLADTVGAEMRKVIVGHDHAVEAVLIGLVTQGHILLEGVPGIGKTLLVRTLAHVLQLDFGRIQFTPDLMPSDITGTTIFNPEGTTFQFKKGPVFAHIILADEINRSPAKTQAALLEVMQEQHVTVDGVTHPVPQPFLVLATQNPIEYEGTYPLPEAEVDRFLMKIVLDYPSDADEIAILHRFQTSFLPAALDQLSLQRVAGADQIHAARAIMAQITTDDSILTYVANILRATRSSPEITLGASPRAGIALVTSAKARAALAGREFITPDDIKEMAFPVLRHRLSLTPELEIEGQTRDDVIRRVLTQVDVPR